MTWREMFPNGRYIYYEGSNPVEFIDEIKDRFSFDPVANHKDWVGEYIEFGSFGFLCPAEHLDAIYTHYPMGS